MRRYPHRRMIWAGLSGSEEYDILVEGRRVSSAVESGIDPLTRRLTASGLNVRSQEVAISWQMRKTDGGTCGRGSSKFRERSSASKPKVSAVVGRIRKDAGELLSKDRQRAVEDLLAQAKKLRG